MSRQIDGRVARPICRTEVWVRRVRGDRGAVQVGAVVAAVAVAVGAGTAGVVTQRALRDDASTSGSVTGDGRGAYVAVDCTGEVMVGRLSGGDRIFVTARSADGALLRIRNPADPAETWWIAAAAVDPDGDLGGLPEVTCDAPDPDQPGDEVAAGDDPADEADPDATTETTEPDPDADPDDPASSDDDPADPNTPTTRRPSGPTTTASQGGGPTPTTAPKPTTTVPADTAGPSLSVSASTYDIWEDFPGLCTGKPRTSTLTAVVSDPSGVSLVQASWSFVGVDGIVNGSTVLTGGGTRTGTVGPYPYATVASGTQKAMQVNVTATDGRGNTSSKSLTIQLHSADQCFG